MGNHGDHRFRHTVPATILERLETSRGAQQRRHGRGPVFLEGDPVDGVYVVVWGRFAVETETELEIRSDSGEAEIRNRPRWLAVLGPGEVFGELGFLTPSETRTATVLSLDEGGTTLCITADRFREMLAEGDTEIVDLVFRVLAVQIQRLSRHASERVLGTEAQVLRRVCELAELYDEGGDSIEIPLSQDQLADLAGVSRDRVGAAFRAHPQLLRTRRGSVGGFTVADLDALAARAYAPPSTARG